MAEATTSLLIEIKTALEAGAMDLANQKLGNLISTQQKQAEADNAARQSQAQLEQGYRKSAEGINKVQNSVSALEGVMGGADGAAGRFGATLQSVGSVGSTLGAYGLAAAAGWKLGSALNDWLKLDQKFSDLINKVSNLEIRTKGLGESLREARREIESANGGTLENIRTEIDATSDSLKTMSDNAAAARAQIGAIEKAQTDLRIAEIDAMDISPAEKKKRKAELMNDSSSKEINRELLDIGAEAGQISSSRANAVARKKDIASLLNSPMNSEAQSKAQQDMASIDQKIAGYDTRLKEIQTREDVLQLNRQTVRVRSSTDIRNADTEIAQDEANKKAAADADAAQKKADAYKANAEMERQKKEAELTQVGESASAAKRTASEAASASAAFDPSRMDLRTKAERTHAITQDRRLEGASVAATADATRLENQAKQLAAALKSYDETVSKTLQALTTTVKTNEARAKNRP